MATYTVYGTSVNLENIPMGTHGDTININAGGTLIITKTPYYQPAYYYIGQNSTVLIDAVSATSPISLALSNFDVKGTLCTTDIWMGTKGLIPDNIVLVQKISSTADVTPVVFRIIGEHILSVGYDLYSQTWF